MRPTILALTAALFAPMAHGQGQGTSITQVTKVSSRSPAAPPTGIAAATVWDHGAGGLLKASSTPALGKLYPLSSRLFVTPTGLVGINTTAPASSLQVNGTFSSGKSQTTGGSSSAAVGGEANVAASQYSAVLGGQQNTVASAHSAIVAGRNNSIGNGTGLLKSFIGGGERNDVQGLWSAVLGGRDNQVQGNLSAVLAGSDNDASGDYCLAAGFGAMARHDGSFVFADNQGLSFATTAPGQFLVRATGGVGIGTETPGTQLDVAGGVHSSGSTGGSFVAFNPLNQGTSVSLSWLNDQARIRIGGSGPGVSNGLEIQRVGNGMIMHVSDQGDVTAGDQMFATGFVQISDARLKTDVRELDGALDAVRQLRGVRFQWDREQRPDAEEGERIGFLAQEVRAVVPEAVRERDDGTLAVAYAELVPVLVEALQEQDRRIAELEALLAPTCGCGETVNPVPGRRP